MTLCDRLLTDLNALSEPRYADFQAKIAGCPRRNILGVRIPALRKLAAKYAPFGEELFDVVNDLFEVRFVKLCAAAGYDYDRFLVFLPRCLDLIDNWALCDGFKAKCIASRRSEFLPVLRSVFQSGRQFYVRYALTTLLYFYVDEEYENTIYDFLSRADCSEYYISTAAAWLLCECIVKLGESAVAFLADNNMDRATHNRTIAKCADSFRLTAEQKNYVKSLKR